MVKPPAHQPDRRSAKELTKQDLAQVLPAIWEAETLEKSIHEAIEAIRAEFGYALLWVGLYDRTNQTLKTGGVLTNGPRRFSQGPISLQPGELLEQVIMQQQPMVVADIREESRAGSWGRIAETFELQGTVLLPIQRKGFCYGIMVLGSRRWGAAPGIVENATLLSINNALAEAIHQNALEEERQNTKQPAKPLFALLKSLSQLSSLDARLKAVAEETQKFVGAPTSIFWLESRGRYVWCRVGKQASKTNKAGNSLPVSEMQSLYQSLCNGEMSAVGELDGSMKASSANRLMMHLSAQSLMVAPIIYQDELQGFLTVEGNKPRIWDDAEKDYVKGVGQLVSLSMPTSEMDNALSRMRSDHLLSAGITRSIHSDHDWLHVLGLCVEQLAARLGTEELLVLNANAIRGGYDLCYRTRQGGAKREHWPPLDPVDEKMVERSHTPVSVESIENELKFAAWQTQLKSFKPQSLLVSNTSPGKAPEGIVIAIDQQARRWTQADRELFQTLSNQIGLIMHQWCLQRQTDQQAQMHETFQWGMRSLQRLTDLNSLDQSATKHIAQTLQVPLVCILSWENGAAFAQASSVLDHSNKFDIDQERFISTELDALLTWAVATEGLLRLKIEDLPDKDNRWISGPPGSQLLAMALRTAPEHEPNAVVLIADSASRQWSDAQVSLLTIVTHQLAWCRRHLKLTALLTEQHHGMMELNWYKQHQIEDLNRGMRTCLKQMMLQTSGKDPREQMLLQTMTDLSSRLMHVTQKERWHLALQSQSTPLISLLKRATGRANPLIQERHLWSKVHCESNITVHGDIDKIEFVLYELISEACQRSPEGDRIDIWCRPLDSQWLEISITDEGNVSQSLLQELADGRPVDLLSPSSLHLPENCHLWVCQHLMETLNGEFTLSQMEDGRTLSRVILPLGNAQ